MADTALSPSISVGKLKGLEEILKMYNSGDLDLQQLDRMIANRPKNEQQWLYDHMPESGTDWRNDPKYDNDPAVVKMRKKKTEAYN